MTLALLRVLLPGQPMAPNSGKWTKLYSSLDFFVIGGFNGCLFALSEVAYQKMSFQELLQKPGGLKVDDGAEADWQQVAGRRYLRTMATLSDSNSQFLRLLLCVVLEPLRYLTFTFLKYGRRVTVFDRTPPVFDMISTRRSPIQWVLQYYSELLRGSSARLSLLWAREGFSSLHLWQAARPEESSLFRRAVLVAASEVQRRHANFFYKTWPIPLLALGDARLDSEERADIVRRFKQRDACCIEYGVGRELRAKFGAKDDLQLLSPAVGKLFQFACGILRLFVAAIESLHARGKRCADPQRRVVHFRQLVRQR